jgi:Xaa-Pro dipeptidase
VTVSEVDRLTRELIESNDVGASLATRAGYSIGIAFPPSWDEGYILSLLEGDERPLEEGMTFHLIPWMWGVDGDKTVGISDTVRITADGCASFLTLPEDFTVHESSARTQVMPVLGGTRP